MLYKDLVKFLQSELSGSTIIKEVGFGAIKEYVEHNKLFPVGFFEPGSITYGIQYTTYNFRLFLLDQVQKSKYNELDIISQMEQVAWNFLYSLAYNPVYGSMNLYTTSSNDVIFFTQDEGLCGIRFSFQITLNRC